MKTPPVYLIAGGAVALAALYVFTRGVKETGQDIGGAAVDFVDGVIGGAVMSAGEIVGIPRTDPQQCEIDKANGDTWAASFSCPAVDFFKYVLN